MIIYTYFYLYCGLLIVALTFIFLSGLTFALFGQKDSNLNRISYEFSLLPMQNNCPVIEDKIFNSAPYPYLNIICEKII